VDALPAEQVRARPWLCVYTAWSMRLSGAQAPEVDIVITTALIPGRPAPELVSKKMVESMAPGSVIVDLAVERGGNCPLSKPGQVVEHNGVTIIGHTNMAGRIAASASHLYSRNLLSLVDILVDKEAKKLAVDWSDEIVEAITLTKDGKVIHPLLAPNKGAKK
jgi:NAD(P) transhydrogenase subunit alpha